MLEVVEAGWGAALMAPTQILAEQHYLNFQRLLGPMGVPVALRTGARRTDNALPLFEGDRPGVIVGTHALLFDGAGLDRLGLVVIDEQHKFGVLQRSKLIDHPDAPDVLVMTATPIPRTLCQTVYGDLDVSVLGERPANRGEVVTVVRDAGKLPDAVEFVRKQIGKGRQAYVVYPLVEESEKLVAKAVMVEFEKWRELLAPHGVGMLHGRMRSDEKEAVMGAFRGRALAALVATTVIEVGVDVPNASVMVIENAERFGLAQLHQLRGRIGRGAHKAFCILLHDADAADDAREKLAVMESTTDGFVVAEADLRLRGPGDMLGTAQTGLPPLRLADLAVDADEMIWARARAAEVFSNDPRLESAGNAAIKRLVERAMARAPATTG
jgi:ATP-dependent DNA helicase RecG